MFKILAKVLSGNIIYFGSSWLMLAFTSTYYGIEEMGVMGLSISVCAPLLLLFGLSPRQLVVTGVIKNRMMFQSSRNSLLFIFSLTLIPMSMVLIDQEYILVFFLFSIFKVVESIYELEYAWLTKAKDFERIFFIQKFRSIQLVLFILTSVFTYSLNLSIIIIIIFNLLLMIKLNVKFTLGFKIKEVLSNVKISSLVSISSFITLLYLNMPRYYLSIDGLYVVGIFTGLVNIINVMRLVVQSGTQSLLPFLSDSYIENKKTKFVKLIFKQLAFILLVSSISFAFYILTEDKALRIIYGNDFVVEDGLIKLTLIYGFTLCVAMILNHAVTAMQLFKHQLYISSFLCISMITIGSLLVKTYSINGAFLSLIFISLIQILLLSISISRELSFTERKCNR